MAKKFIFSIRGVIVELKEILVFEEYGGDMNYVLDALYNDVYEQLFEKTWDEIQNMESWKDILELLKKFNINPNNAENKFIELKKQLLNEIIKSAIHDCSYYPEHQAFYDAKIEQAINDLE